MRNRWTIAGLGLVGAVLAGGCASAQSQQETDGVGTAPGQYHQQVDPHALDAWAQFPVDAKPRPIVLISSAVLNPGNATGEAKLAASQAGYALPATVPDLPLPTASVALPDGQAELLLVDAKTAFGLLRLDVQPTPSGEPLPITHVALGTATFHTDRGDLVLPAWLFTAKDGLGPIAVPALAPSAFWHLERQPTGGPPQPATISPDGRVLTVPVPAPASGCPGDPVGPPKPVVVSAPGAVAVGSEPDLSSVVPGSPDDTCARPAILRFVPITVTLDQPLGNRVLVDATGNPFAVVPA